MLFLFNRSVFLSHTMFFSQYEKDFNAQRVVKLLRCSIHHKQTSPKTDLRRKVGNTIRLMQLHVLR